MRNCAPSRKTGSETAVKADAGRDALSDRRLGRTDLSVSVKRHPSRSPQPVIPTQPYPDLAPRKAVRASAKHYRFRGRIHHHAGLLACGRRRDRHGASWFRFQRPAQTDEEQLKRGQLRCVVATSSLELGIDMGSVDLVIQIAPPLSVSSGLQRVGAPTTRSGESRMHCSTRLHESKSSARPQASNACAPETSKH